MKLFLVASVVCFSYFGSCRQLQRTIVKGRLLCGTQPIVDVKVKLFDEGNAYEHKSRVGGGNLACFPDIVVDDLLDEKRTNASGHFLVDGVTRETTRIEPVAVIYHDCDAPVVSIVS